MTQGVFIWLAILDSNQGLKLSELSDNMAI